MIYCTVECEVCERSYIFNLWVSEVRSARVHCMWCASKSDVLRPIPSCRERPGSTCINTILTHPCRWIMKLLPLSGSVRMVPPLEVLYRMVFSLCCVADNCHSTLCCGALLMAQVPCLFLSLVWWRSPSDVVVMVKIKFPDQIWLNLILMLPQHPWRCGVKAADYCRACPLSLDRRS